MPCSRQISATGFPVSCSFKIPRIWLSVNFDFFIASTLKLAFLSTFKCYDLKGSLHINACKKPALESVKQDTSGPSLIPMSASSIESKRNLSPYSIKALREVRVMLKRLSSAKAVAAGNQSLDPDNYQH